MYCKCLFLMYNVSIRTKNNKLCNYKYKKEKGGIFMKDNNVSIKTATEIGMMCSQLDSQYQTLVLNTINTLLFAQQVQQQESK